MIDPEIVENAYNQILSQLERVGDENLIQTIYNTVDGIAEAQLKNITQCGKQECSFCCHSKIYLTPLEAEYIKQNATFELNQELLEKQNQVEDFNKDLTFAEKACVMLKNGKCQIYIHRPLVCRKHYVVDVIPEKDCKQDDEGKTTLNNEPYHPVIEAFVYHLIMKTKELKTLNEYF